MNPVPKRRGPGRALLRLHRRIGIALSSIFILICLTGIALNHASDLNLNKKRVTANWIYNWYGIKPKGTLIHYPLEGGSLSLLSNTLYFNTNEIAPLDNLVGALALDDFYIAASSKELILLSREGELVERLTKQSLPAENIIRIQTTDSNTIIIETAASAYQSDKDFLSWTPTIWQPANALPQPQPASKNLQQALQANFRGKGLSWNRIVLDLHSGRFFGNAGKWIADLSALSLVFLTLSGIYYTIKYLKKARARSN